MSSGINKECVTCNRIADCAEVTPQKVLAHYVCFNYEEVAQPEKIQARCDIITKFGESGIKALLDPDTEES